MATSDDPEVVRRQERSLAEMFSALSPDETRMLRDLVLRCIDRGVEPRGRRR